VDAQPLGHAFAFALHAHGDQRRKGTDIPYVSHLMGVASLVLEDEGGIPDASAALLHDVVEDTSVSIEDVEARFGPYVSRIVRGCSDSLVHGGKAPWRERKEAYLAHLPEEPPEVLRVSVADKLHNARSILADVREHGVGTFDRFNGKREGTLWYYRTLVQTYRSIPEFCSRWLDELEYVVGELDQRTRSAG